MHKNVNHFKCKISNLEFKAMISSKLSCPQIFHPKQRCKYLDIKKCPLQNLLRQRNLYISRSFGWKTFCTGASRGEANTLINFIQFCTLINFIKFCTLINFIKLERFQKSFCRICPKRGWGVPNLQTSSVQKLIPQIGKGGGVTPLWTDSAKNVF